MTLATDTLALTTMLIDPTRADFAASSGKAIALVCVLAWNGLVYTKSSIFNSGWLQVQFLGRHRAHAASFFFFFLFIFFPGDRLGILTRTHHLRLCTCSGLLFISNMVPRRKFCPRLCRSRSAQNPDSLRAVDSIYMYLLDTSLFPNFTGPLVLISHPKSAQSCESESTEDMRRSTSLGTIMLVVL